MRDIGYSSLFRPPIPHRLVVQPNSPRRLFLLFPPLPIDRRRRGIRFVLGEFETQHYLASKMVAQRLLQFIRGGFHLKMAMCRRQTKHTLGFAKFTQLAMLRQFSRQSVQLQRGNDLMPLPNRSFSLVTMSPCR